VSEQTVALPARSRSARARVRLPQGAALLSLGTLASGVLAYVFNVLAARALGPAEYGPIAVFWAAMFLTSVVLFRPAEQTLARTIAERLAHGQDATAVARTVGRLTLVACGVVTIATVAAWAPLTDELFSGHSYLTVCLWGSIIGYALSYYVRGLTSGLQRFGSYGGLLLVDGAARVFVAAPLLAIASPELAAAAMVAAAFLGAVTPLLDRANRPRAIAAALRGTPTSHLDLREAVRFALPVGIIAGAEQTLVSGGALLAVITADGNAAAAAATVFAATMLVRAPVFLFQGVAAALLPRFTELYARGQRERVRRALLGAGVVTVALSVVLAAGALAVGPELMRLLFGSAFEVDRLDLAVLTAGVGAYLAAATLSQAGLARNLAGRCAAVWTGAASVFVAIDLLLEGAPLHRVSVAFTIATTLGAISLAFAVLRARD